MYAELEETTYEDDGLVDGTPQKWYKYAAAFVVDRLAERVYDSDPFREQLAALHRTYQIDMAVDCRDGA